MLAVCQACQFFLPDINQQGGLVSKILCTLPSDLLVWAQNNLRSLKATHCAEENEPRSRHNCRRTMSLQRKGRSTRSLFREFGKFWQRSSRPLRLRRQLSLPNLFYKEHGCPGPRMAQPSALCLPHVLIRVREQRHKLILIAQ